ncbi:MAG: hypothetical protein ABSD47_15615, partial [Candidatus Methylomirabilota bacterium]
RAAAAQTRALTQGEGPQVFLQAVPGGGLIASPGTPRVNNPAAAYALAGWVALASVLGLGLLWRRGRAASADPVGEPPTVA